MSMSIITLSLETQHFADEIQSAMHHVMGEHAESVGFKDQISIIGVAIGSLLDQLPAHDRDYFTRILMQNVRDARKYSMPVRLQ